MINSMRIIRNILNILLGVHLFGVANLIFWISLLGLVAAPHTSISGTLQNYWIPLTNILFAPFFIYSSINFFRKTEKKYKYALVLLLIYWAHMQLFRFFFIADNKLEKADFSNLLLFIGPFVVVYLTKLINEGVQKSSNSPLTSAPPSSE